MRPVCFGATAASLPRRSHILVLAALGVAAVAPSPAGAVVRFGHDVFIGGHDFSHQTYDRNHRAVIHLYEHTPANAGCVWHGDGHGGRVKVCRLRRLPPRP